MAKEPKAKKSDAGRVLTREESVLRGNKWRQEKWFERADELFFDTDIAGQRKQQMLDQMSARRAAERAERRKAAEKRAAQEAIAAADELRARAEQEAYKLQARREELLSQVSSIDADIKDLKTVASAGK